MSDERPESDFDGPHVADDAEPDADGVRPSGESGDVDAETVKEEVREKLD